MSQHLVKLLLLCYILSQTVLTRAAAAQSKEEMDTLRLFYREEELVVSATRNEKPISQAAENITVITAKEIEEMNAHTLTDVLNIVTGVQMEIRGGPGSATFASVQGSDYRHVLVLIDGVSLNNLSDNYADIGAIPVKNVERIEIIKGPASSAWGSSLGGVVNIITKSVGYTVIPEGTVSASYGEKETSDIGVDVRGKAGGMGYYLSAGNKHSNGFNPNQPVDSNSIYTKFKMDLSKRMNLMLSAGYNKGSGGFGEDAEFDISFSHVFEYTISTLSLSSQLADGTYLDLSARTSLQNYEILLDQISTGEQLDKSSYDERTVGGSAKFSWKGGMHAVGLGVDYDKEDLESSTILSGGQDLEKWAVFINDTLGYGKLSVTPGIRYDYTSSNGDFISPSLGLTYDMPGNTVLRGSIARGFNTPPLTFTYGSGPFFTPNPALEVEKVWSYQAGVESSVFKYFWLKTTVFRHDIDDAIVDEELPDGTFTKVNEDKLRRQGVELEFETMRVFNTSVKAGSVIQDVRDRNTDHVVKNIPKYTYDVGLKYDDRKSFTGRLAGHYIWWNAEGFHKGEYDSFVWDLYLNKKFYSKGKQTIGAFFSVHNIFDGSQYLDSLFRNPGRWVEAGVNLKF